MGLEASKIEWNEEAPNREKVMFFAVFVLMVYLFGVYLWGPQRSKTKQVRKEVAEYTQRLDTLEKTIKKLAEVKKQVPQQKKVTPRKRLTETDPRFERYRRGDIPRPEAVQQQVVAAMTNSDILSGVTLEALSFDRNAVSEHENFQQMPFTLLVNGAYGAIVKYFERLEKEPLLVVFHGMDVVAPEENRAELKTTLKGALYIVHSAAALRAPGN